MGYALDIFQQKALKSFKVDVEGVTYEIHLEQHDGGSGGDPSPKADHPSDDNEDYSVSFKKRKLADTSMTHEDAAEFIAELSIEELRKFALDAHSRLVEAERRYEELQSQIQSQATQLESQGNRLTALEERLNIGGSQPSPGSTTDRPAGSNSWADVVLRNIPDERKAEVIHARQALKSRPQSKPVKPRIKGEQEFGVRIIYVDGIQRMRFREIKGHLKCLGFSLTKILSMSFVGHSTIEFIVDEDYAGHFVQQIRSRTDGKVLQDFDPIKPLSPSVIPDVARKSCARRLYAILTRDETPWAVRKVLESFVEERGLFDDLAVLDSEKNVGNEDMGVEEQREERDQ
jgi:hypothetical protein